MGHWQCWSFQKCTLVYSPELCVWVNELKIKRNEKYKFLLSYILRFMYKTKLPLRGSNQILYIYI